MARTWLFLAYLLAACGGGGGDIDAAPPDAAAADAGIDAEVSDPCEVLCECAEANCDDDLATCMTQCADLPASVRTCRIMHCGYAQQNPVFHCPHVAGDPNSPGVPAACIYPEGADAGVIDAP